MVAKYKNCEQSDFWEGGEYKRPCQKQKNKKTNKKKNKDPVLLIADLQHNLKSGIFMMHSKRRSSLEARRQVMQ